jgi:uncharacterized protein (TIGR02678 family)
MPDDEELLPLSPDVDEGLWSDTTEAEEPDWPSAQLPVYSSRHALQAHALLLDTPVVSLQHDAEAYRLVRTHFTAIEKWHEEHTGWRVQRGPSFFRLERHLHAPVSPVLDEKLKRPRDFVCLTWVLWFAEQRHLAGGGRNQQFLLSQLAEELQRQSQESPGAALDFRNLQDRYSMRRALEYLTELGGLQTLEGEVKKWEDAPDNEVLYEFTPISHSLIEALNQQRIAAMSSQIARWNHTLQVSELEGAEPGQNIPPLVRVWRTLLLGPALFRRDDPAAFATLLASAEQVSEELAQSFGWLLELNRDYACIVRGGTLSIGAGPTLTLNAAHDQMILLLCTELRRQVEAGSCSPDAFGCLHVTSFDLNALFSNLRQRYGSYWGASVKESKATDLLAEIYARMRLLGLLRGPDAEGHVLILPTAARYSVGYNQEPAQADSADGQTPGTVSTARVVRIRGRRAATRSDAPQLTFGWSSAEETGGT